MGSKRVFNLRCQDPQAYDTWMVKLKHSIFSSNGFKKKLSMNMYIEDMSNYFDYWRFLRITEDAFIRQAEVGDLILCSTKKKVNIPRRQEVLRSQTMVQHLCLVVKLQTGVPEKKKDEVFIIRVGNNLDQGIVIQSWEEFRIYKT